MMDSLRKEKLGHDQALQRGPFYFPPCFPCFTTSQQSLVCLHLQSPSPNFYFYCRNEVSPIIMGKFFIRTGVVAFNKGIISRSLAGTFCSMSWVHLVTCAGRPIKFVERRVISNMYQTRKIDPPEE